MATTGERVTVIGGGSWGTTLSLLATQAGCSATLYVRNSAQAAAMRRTRLNERYLPGIILPDTLTIASDLTDACSGAAMIVLAVPSQAMRATARQAIPVAGDAVFVSAAKGLERGSLLRMSEVLRAELGAAAVDRVCALSGPNLAMEIARGMPAATVIAGPEAALSRVGNLLRSPQFRCYTSADLIGVEMAGALKNIVAIGAGIADGLEAGDNAKAAFLARGVAEIGRLGLAAGANPLTFAGLAGLGDLVATCASPLSRNHRLGRALAKGKTLSEAAAEIGQVAEGIFATETAIALGRRHGVEMPITEQLSAVLFASKPVPAAIQELMLREPKDELDGMRPDLLRQ